MAVSAPAVDVSETTTASGSLTTLSVERMKSLLAPARVTGPDVSPTSMTSGRRLSKVVKVPSLLMAATTSSSRLLPDSISIRNVGGVKGDASLKLTLSLPAVTVSANSTSKPLKEPSFCETISQRSMESSVILPEVALLVITSRKESAGAVRTLSKSSGCSRIPRAGAAVVAVSTPPGTSSRMNSWFAVSHRSAVNSYLARKRL